MYSIGPLRSVWPAAGVDSNMDDRIPGTDPPTITSEKVMELLTSAAEVREFERFQSELAESTNKPVDQRSAVQIWLSEHAPRWRRRRQLTAAQLQAEEIRKYRWIESEKKKADVGKDAHLDWVKAYAADWRRWFENHYDGPLVDRD